MKKVTRERKEYERRKRGNTKTWRREGYCQLGGRNNTRLGASQTTLLRRYRNIALVIHVSTNRDVILGINIEIDFAIGRDRGMDIEIDTEIAIINVVFQNSA